MSTESSKSFSTDHDDCTNDMPEMAEIDKRKCHLSVEW